MAKTNDKLATPEEMVNLPDLPALESVKTDRGFLLPLLVIGAFSLFYTTVVVWGYLRFREFMDDSGKIMVGIVLLSAIWVVGRVAFAYSSFNTDRSGLTLKGPLRRRFIPWTEIKEARTTVTRSGNFCVKLDTAHGQISILPRGFGLSVSSADGVIASIWQNLRHMGRAEGMLIPKTALSFWEPVPDDVPEEMDWGKPPANKNRIANTIIVAVFVAMTGCLWTGLPRNIFMWFFNTLYTITWVLMVKYLFIPELFRQAYCVSVRSSYIECLLLWRKVYIPWDSVVSVRWQRNYFCIRSGNGQELRVPFYFGDTGSENLILAIVRKLRSATSPHLIALPARLQDSPEVLNRQAYSSEQQTSMQRAFLNTLDEAARKKIQRLWGLNVSFILIGMAFGAALGLSDMVGILARFIHMRSDSGTLHFLMMDTLFYSVSIFVFMVGGGVFGEWLGFRLAGHYKDEWGRYIKVGNGSGKISKVIIWTASVIGIISLLSIPLVIDCYARVTDRGFAVNHFFELRERVYPWDRVRAVEEQIISNVGSKSGSMSTFIIKFADGYCWRMKESSVRASRQDELRQAVEFVAKKSGKQIVWR